MLKIVTGKNGRMVVTEKIIKAGEVVLPFHGEILSGDELPYPYESVDDHYVQIGENLYMGPSGGADDFIRELELFFHQYFSPSFQLRAEMHKVVEWNNLSTKISAHNADLVEVGNYEEHH